MLRLRSEQSNEPAPRGEQRRLERHFGPPKCQCHHRRGQLLPPIRVHHHRREHFHFGPPKLQLHFGLPKCDERRLERVRGQIFGPPKLHFGPPKCHRHHHRQHHRFCSTHQDQQRLERGHGGGGGGGGVGGVGGGGVGGGDGTTRAGQRLHRHHHRPIQRQQLCSRLVQKLWQRLVVPDRRRRRHRSPCRPRLERGHRICLNSKKVVGIKLILS